MTRTFISRDAAASGVPVKCRRAFTLNSARSSRILRHLIAGHASVQHYNLPEILPLIRAFHEHRSHLDQVNNSTTDYGSATSASAVFTRAPIHQRGHCAPDLPHVTSSPQHTKFHLQQLLTTFLQAYLHDCCRQPADGAIVSSQVNPIYWRC